MGKLSKDRELGAHGQLLRRHSELDPHHAFLLGCVPDKDDITMPSWRPNSDLAPAHQKRIPLKDNAAGQRTRSAMQEWQTRRQPLKWLEPRRLVFIDETGTTKMTACAAVA
ncbi:hypothetical protein NKJ51_31355 [Mesorhizobium sp. M0134]|uniref:hypothetical protein n=1 Tax=Mesorhizobium sp. M0134 TaxID=2956889 RepID=UPI00333992CA